MLKSYTCAAIATIANCAVNLPLHAEEPKFNLRAWPPGQVTTGSGKVLIHVDLTNSGKSSAPLCYDNAGPDHAELDFRIRVHDSAGHVPRLTALGERIFHSIQFDSSKCKALEPQQVHPETVALNTLYVLEPGHTYTVSFTEKGERLAIAKSPVDSNWVTVTVK
jgi:hypothetical protein